MHTPPLASHPLPLVAVSACLLGEKVRYDGTHRQNAILLQKIGPHCRFLSLCPETEMGLGIPRETLQIVPQADGTPHLLGNESGTDWTSKLEEWLAHKLKFLQQSRIAGYVMKARSPSCAAGSYPLDSHADGLFTAALRRTFPTTPILEGESLHDPQALMEFLEKIQAPRR